LAQVPVNQELQCALGNYVAFTSPGMHRITIRNNNGDDLDKRSGECQRAKKHTLGIFENDDTLQTVLFDINIQDVVTTIAGVPVANGDTITLIQRQRAPFAVRDQAGNDIKTNHLIFTSQSKIGIQGGASELQAGNVNTPAGAGEAVEFMRVYQFSTDKFDDDSLSPGVHLAKGNIQIPVRNFNVQVIDRPAVVKAVPDAIKLDLYTPVTPEIHPNETFFVLVPAPFIKKDDPKFEYPLPTNPPPPDPSVTVDILADLSGFSQSVRDFIGPDGRILSVKLNPTPAPVGDPFLLLPITVGSATDSTVVTARIPIRP
jgi:hypothetical protein